MKLYTRENSKESKEIKKFVSRHSRAFTDWEILYRSDKGIYDEIPLDNFLDIISKDYHSYTIFLNNIKVRLTK